jgi:hypothetical protein
MAERTILLEECTIQELDEEATTVREVLTEVLNQKGKKLTLCARSKRWWNQTIIEKRRILGFWKRERRARRST